MKQEFANFLLIVAWVIFLIWTIKHGKDKREKMESNVGRMIVVKRDTLLIQDFSQFNRNYKLSNGTVIFEDYCEELLNKK